jgi:hypothetical protein
MICHVLKAINKQLLTVYIYVPQAYPQSMVGTELHQADSVEMATVLYWVHRSSAGHSILLIHCLVITILCSAEAKNFVTLTGQASQKQQLQTVRCAAFCNSQWTGLWVNVTLTADSEFKIKIEFRLANRKEPITVITLKGFALQTGANEEFGTRKIWLDLKIKTKYIMGIYV